MLLTINLNLYSLIPALTTALFSTHFPYGATCPKILQSPVGLQISLLKRG